MRKSSMTCAFFSFIERDGEDMSNQKTIQSEANRMGSQPVGKLMAAVGLPIVISMMLQAVYNIVDSAFLSNMQEAGEQALTALGLAFPVQLLLVAFGVGTGVGANALLSKCLGMGDKEKASYVTGNALVLAVIIYVIFLLFGIFGVPWYIHSQSAGGAISDTSLSMAIDYLRICCCVSFGIVFFNITEKFLQATGRSLYSTIAQISGAVFNIVVDPILIYGWFGFPQMGVRGAAVATVGGQILSALLALIFHFRMNREIDKRPRYMKFSFRIFQEIYAIGLPAIISQALLTVMTYGMNLILVQIHDFGENFVTVYGLYCKIQQLVIFAAVGLRDAITPIVSFNQGMRNRSRVREGIRYGILYTIILMVIGLLIMELFTRPLTAFFSLSDTTFDLCMSCIRIVSLAFIFAGLNIAFQGFFQALEGGMQSLLVSVGRQVVFILPIAWALVRMTNQGGDLNLVWWTFLIGEGLTFLCAVLMYYGTMRKKINALEGRQTIRPESC